MDGGRLETLGDRELLEAVGDGERAAFRALYDRHAPWLLARLSRRCADAETVDEVLQDTFLAVWRGAHRYRGQGEVAAWIWEIAIRGLIDPFCRRRTPVSLLGEETSGEASAEERVLLGAEHGERAGALVARLGCRGVMQVVRRSTGLDYFCPMEDDPGLDHSLDEPSHHSVVGRRLCSVSRRLRRSGGIPCL